MSGAERAARITAAAAVLADYQRAAVTADVAERDAGRQVALARSLGIGLTTRPPAIPPGGSPRKSPGCNLICAAIWPYGPCLACLSHRGKNRGSNSRCWGRCKRCKGAGEQIRWGYRLIRTSRKADPCGKASA